MKKLILSTLLLLGVMTSVFAQEKYDIRLNLEKGQTFTYQVTANNPMTISMMGQQMEIKQAQTVTYTYKVLDVKDGNYLMESNIDRMQVSSSSMGQEMNVDTDSEAKDEVTNQMRKVVNQKVTQWVDAKLKPLGEPEGENVDDQVKKGVLAIAMVPAFFPAEPIAQGESFTVSRPLFTGDNADEQYEGVVMLVAVSDTDYTFRANGKTTANFEGLVIEGNGIDNIVLDRKTGMVKNTFGTMALKGSGNVQGTQAEISSNTITSIRLL
ncbi:MAG: hypothetical protein JNG44_03285 [Porphyromonas sp.]|uniref:hypothetical protein n=1 Tax=Porphyromonas sp. TaxID=1924944 RepID=UPI001A41CE48|nr:hypothetical protein [Porphyromonas sp.]MBL6452706.1 hypothetical protein [Porphyromonas sp.]